MDANCDRNKVLIAFETGAGEGNVGRTEALERIFGLDADKAQDNIVKNLTWSTKYYQSQYDLYVDEFEDVSDWLKELNGAHCEELRAALAGVIVMKSFDPEDQTSTAVLEQFSSIQGAGSFLVWCNTSQVVGEGTLDRANSTMARSNANAEMVSWHCSRSMNEYGEKVGPARIREIIDTHEWANTHTAATSNPALPQFEERQPLRTDNLAAVVNKLQKARQQYQSLDDDGEASSFAAAIAEEIAELL
ncbi:hypothetical protein HG536_0D05800 [Torulaspora globosa]|uniref:Increased recombination centers protein 6 n=1 Tax=Torulaspora globosa TaxID=48254 RepID=A0A7G3ZHS3_9SACH|nr:uncharacterized protein HG536_0D05800 [Torulaspora globosa]QLL33059.1 hypothetical protein HG536_0D05800 [Torulaspora globosa]